MKKLLPILFIFSGFSFRAAAQFTAGNLVVEQVGTGAAALTSASTAIFLKEYTPAGTAGITVTIPATGATALTISGSAGSEGNVTRAADGNSLIVAGYNTPAGQASVSGTTAAAVSRAIGAVDASGTYSQIATTNTFFSGNNIRSATGDGNGNYWAAGASSGIVYFTAGSNGTVISSTSTNNRVVSIFNGNLYVSSNSGSFKGVNQIGSGLPVTPGAMATLVVSDPANSYGYAFNAAGTVCYVADGTSGIIKYTLSGGTWSQAYVLNTTAANSLVADFSNTNPVIYAVASSGAAFYKVTDAGSAGAASTLLATAPANTAFRSVAFAPAPAMTVTGTFTVAGQSGLSSLTAMQGTAGSPGSFQLSGSDIANTVTISAPSASFQVATAAGGPYSSSITITPSAGALPGQPVTIYVRISAAAAAGPVSGDVAVTSTGSTTGNVAVSGTVTGPMLSANPASLSFSSVSGAASATQTVTFTGSNLSAAGTASITGPFEFSTDGISFQTTDISIPVSGGNLSQVLYVRLTAGNPPGIVSGAVSVTSGAATAAAALSGQVSQPFGTDNIVVLRAGNGTGTLINTGNPLFLDEYTTTGTLVQSIALPTATSGDNHPIVLSGVSTSEGIITRSADGRYLAIAGYDAALPNAVALSGSSYNRDIALVSFNGVVDVTTSLNDFSPANNPRSAFTTNGTDIYAVGGAGGLRYATKGTVGSSVNIYSTVPNLRTVGYAEYGGVGQLFLGTSSGSSFRIGAVSGGTPATAGQTVTPLPGLPVTNAPYQFFFADLTDGVAGADVLYVAGAPGGIAKYSLVGGTWTANGAVTASLNYYGLAGKADAAGNVTLFATRGFDGSATGNGGTLVSLTDNAGYNAAIGSPAINILDSTGTNTNTHIAGVALAPANTNCTGNTVVWRGNASANTAFAGNWCGGVPTATSNAVIPTSGINMPRTATGILAVNDLTINAAATLAVRSTAELQIAGVTTLNGTLDATDGAVTFNGAATQSIPALSVKQITFNGAGFTLAGPLNAALGAAFTAGKVFLNDNNLALGFGGMYTGGSNASYAVTNGTGLVQASVGSAPVVFPVGRSSYNPATLSNNGAGATTTGFSVTISEDVLDGGTTGSTVTSPVVNRTWNVDADGSGTANATITLQWNNGETLGDFDYNHVYVAHYDENASEWMGLTASAATAPVAGGYPGAGPYTAMASGITGFSPFTVASNSALVDPLPVSLTSLSARNEGAQNHIYWTSGAEPAAASYEVQWTTDGIAYQTIATQAGKGSNHAYGQLHPHPAAGANYYRLKMTEAGGTVSYSAIVSAVVAKAGQAIALQPNPASDAVTVTLPGAPAAGASISLLDASGRVWMTQEVAGSTAVLNLRQIPAGLYFVKYVAGETSTTTKLIKK